MNPVPLDPEPVPFPRDGGPRMEKASAASTSLAGGKESWLGGGVPDPRGPSVGDGPSPTPSTGEAGEGDRKAPESQPSSIFCEL